MSVKQKRRRLKLVLEVTIAIERTTSTEASKVAGVLVEVLKGVLADDPPEGVLARVSEVQTRCTN